MKCFFFFQAEDGIRDVAVTGVQTCALPIYYCSGDYGNSEAFTQLAKRLTELEAAKSLGGNRLRSEEHTSELQSRLHLVCRLLLEKKKNNTQKRLPILLPPTAVVDYLLVAI